MADPTDPTTLDATAAAADNVSQSLNTMSDVAVNAQSAMGALDEAVQDTKIIFEGFSNSINKFGVSLKSNEALTAQQATQFGLLTTAVFGARKAFDSLGGIDSKPLNTFSDQIQFLSSNLGDSSDAIGALVDLAEKGFGAIVPDSAKKSIGAIKGFLGNLAESADNALRLQNAYVQLSARTGNLGEVFKLAGNNLGDMNALLSQQNMALTTAMKATGVSEKAIQDYYMALGSVPKALEAQVTSSGNADTKISMLTATIKAATGTGREYSDVIEDLKIAFREYGITGEDALIFTTRFSELSNKFGVELDDVRKALIGSANAFSMFADAGDDAAKMSEGLASIMNSYVGALQSTGLSGHNAIGVINSMTNALANMRVEQKAFLSQQTGGPGGLMGGFQIEKMLREGKIDEVFDKVRLAMQKQFGKIVTLNEAASSPAAASQLEKQMLLLQRGPLGQFAKSDQDAYRILEAFSKKQSGVVSATPLDPRGLANAMDKGTAIEEKSYTQLTLIRNEVESLRKAAETANLGSVQQMTTASAGGGAMGGETPAQRAYRLSLQNNMSAAPGGGDFAVNSIKDFQAWFKTIPDSFKAGLDTLKQAISTGTKEDVNAALSKTMDDIKAKKEAAATMSQDAKMKELALAQMEEDNAKKMVAWYMQNSNKNVGLPTFSSLSENDFGEPITAGSNLGSATKNTPSSKSGGPKVVAPGATVTESGNEITVHINGYCIKCKNEIDGGKQSASITPAGKMGP